MLLPHNQKVFDEICSALKQTNNVCIIQGTGTGKSFLFMHTIKELFPKEKIAYVMPKNAIKENLQEYEDFKRLDTSVDFFTNNYFSSEDKVSELFNEYDVFVVDEAHHMGSNLYGGHIQSLLEKVKTSSKVFLGLTATPERDCDGLNICQFFDSVVNGLSIFECIERNLMPQIEYLVCQPEETYMRELRAKIDYDSSISLLQDIISTNQKKRWICFFSDLDELKAHRKIIASLFPSHTLYEIHSESGTKIKDIAQENIVILSVDKLLEGVHLDKMGGILLFRNIHSLNVFQQVLGRVMSIGSTESPLIVDCTNTAVRLLAKLMARDGRLVTDAISTGYRHDDFEEKRPVMYFSLTNSKYFDIESLLLKMDGYFEFRGMWYKNFKTCCQAFGFKDSTVDGYARDHECTKQEALEHYVECGIQRETGPFCFEGTTYQSKNKCCEAFSVGFSRANTLSKRKNISFDEALRFCIDNPLKEAEEFEWRGRVYNSLSRCCNENELPYKVAKQYHTRHRHDVGYQIADALDFAEEKKNSFTLCFGVKYQTIADVCRAHEVGDNVVTSRMRKYGCSAEEAIAWAIEKKKNQPKPFPYDGVIHDTPKKCAEAHNLNWKSICNLARIKGISKEEALTEVLHRQKLQGNQIILI